MDGQLWSWILTAIGLAGFFLAGKKVWWSWYINIGNQAVWLAYALTTKQYGFIVGTIAYSIVFTKNAIEWTREHKIKTLDEITHQPIGRITDIMESIDGISIGFTFDNDQFVKQMKKTESAIASAAKRIPPTCTSKVLFDGVIPITCSLPIHPEQLDHYRRHTTNKVFGDGSKTHDIFWDKLGLSQVIEVKED